MDTIARAAFDVTIRFRLPRQLLARLKRIAGRKCKLVSELQREAVIRFVESEEHKSSKLKKSR